MDKNSVLRERAKVWFELNGVSITEWATERGFDRDQVYAVLSGRTKGLRGQAHHIAVALGLKPVLKPPAMPDRPAESPAASCTDVPATALLHATGGEMNPSG